MGENLPVIISFACHHGGPDLAQPYAMSPTGSGQDEKSGDLELYIFFVHDKSRAVQMCFGQGPAYLQFFADGKGPMCPDNLQHFNTAGSSSFVNNGTININGKNGYGIYAEGTSKVTNSGDIYLNATTATKTSSAL